MKYEYRVLVFRGGGSEAIEKDLNDLGAEGFKLIAVTECFDTDGDSTGDSLYLMREVPSNP